MTSFLCSPRRWAPAVAVAAALAGAAPALLAQAAKPRIERAAELPRFSYKLDAKVEELVRSAPAFAALAAQVRRDAEAVLAGYEIADKATRRELLGQLAALDFLAGDYDRAILRTAQIRSLQDQPTDTRVSDLRLRVMARAAVEQGLGSAAYQSAVSAAMARELAALPRAAIENEVREAKAGIETLGEGRLIGRLREVVQPVVDATGSLSSDFVPGLINTRMALVALLPLKAVLTETYGAYLAAGTSNKPDLWAAREVTLPPLPKRAPVPLAVWDSGTDTSLFAAQLQRDKAGKPALIAFDRQGRPAQGDLQPLPAALRSKLPQLRARAKGFSDLQSNIDSAEAAAVKEWLSTLSAAQFKPALEELGQAGNYEHGTHIAGAALAGNPFARLIVGRIEFGHTLKPDPCPSPEQSERDAKSQRAAVDYFRQQGARIVNISWGSSVGAYESDLEQCGIGKSPEDRKELARAYFELAKLALTRAMASAPQVLFVTAAGNTANDPSVVATIPAAIVLPNLLTVGAVDRAGEEASITSYGPTVKLHANGFQVESALPGGDRVALSGASMAAPQATNLAAKMLAVNPKLTPQQLIKLMLDTAERSADGRRVLMHPKQAVAAAGAAN
jgi:Subtilase family